MPIASKNNDWKRDIERLFSKTSMVRQISVKTGKGRIVKTRTTDTIVNRFKTSRGFKMFKKQTMTGLTGGINQRKLYYAIYDQMEATPEISSALDIIADNCTVPDEKDDILKISSEDQTKVKILEILFFDCLNIEFNLWPWIRNLTKYGDMGLLLDIIENRGITNYTVIPAWAFERKEGEDLESPEKVYFDIPVLGSREKISNADFIHFRLLNDIKFLPYGRSYLEPARVIWKQLIALEDSMLVYRITRAPERRIYFIDVEGIATDDVEQYVENIKLGLKSNFDVNTEDGVIDYRFTSMSPIEDYYIPATADKQTTRIETLPGGENSGIVEEVEFLQSKLFAALKIPKSFLTFDEDISGKTTLGAQDVSFARTISRIQKAIVAELKKIAIIHLFSLGYRDDDLLDFEIKLTNSSTISEKQKFELIRDKVETFQSAIEGGLSRRWAYENIWEISEDKINDLQKEIISDAKLKYRLTSIEEEGRDNESEKETDQEMQDNKFNFEKDEKTDMEKDIDDLEDTGEDELDNTYGDKRVLSWSKHPVIKDGKVIIENKKVNTKNDLLEIFDMSNAMKSSVFEKDLEEKNENENKYEEIIDRINGEIKK